MTQSIELVFEALLKLARRLVAQYGDRKEIESAGNHRRKRQQREMEREGRSRIWIGWPTVARHADQTARIAIPDLPKEPDTKRKRAGITDALSEI